MAEGIGKPKPLRGNLSGWWSRRIDDANRIVYRIQDNRIESSSAGLTTGTNNKAELTPETPRPLSALPTKKPGTSRGTRPTYFLYMSPAWGQPSARRILFAARLRSEGTGWGAARSASAPVSRSLRYEDKRAKKRILRPVRLGEPQPQRHLRGIPHHEDDDDERRDAPLEPE